FKSTLIPGGHQPLGGVHQYRISADQHAPLVLLHSPEDCFCGLFRGRHGDAFKHFGNLVLTTHAHTAHFTHAAITGNVGLDAAGMDTGGADAAAFEIEFFAQRFSKASDGELRCIVGRLGWYTDDAEYAGDVDHMTVAGLLQVRKKSLGAIYHTPEVDIHEPFKIFIAHGLHRFPETNTGIVDDQVHLAMFLDSVLSVLINRSTITDINMMQRYLHWIGLELVQGLRQTFVIDV